MTDYADRWITCTDSGIQVRAYYFPWGTKRIPYSQIRSVQRVSMGALTGRARIWGTANPQLWASLDPKRATKNEALVIDLGQRVKPFLTPDDAAAVVTAIQAHTSAPIETTDRGRIV